MILLKLLTVSNNLPLLFHVTLLYYILYTKEIRHSQRKIEHFHHREFTNITNEY
jgi:hypothetical protein